jgi:hypothetical protein
MLDKAKKICYNKRVVRNYKKYFKERNEVCIMENTQNTVKVTKRIRFEQIKALVGDYAELVAFIDHEIELLNKKNSRSGKPTKTQVENESIKNTIFDTLQAMGKPVTVTQLLATDELNGLSNQKVSALLTQLRESGKVERTVEKKVAYYSIKEESDEIEEVEE